MGQPTPVLASASPRRRDLLAALGLEFVVRPTDVEESSEEPDPQRRASQLALRKARAAAAAHPSAPVIAADTIVVLDGRVLGKPDGADEAAAMLGALRGRSHEVVSAVAVASEGREAVEAATTAVTMRDYGDDGDPALHRPRRAVRQGWRLRRAGCGVRSGRERGRLSLCRHRAAALDRARPARARRVHRDRAAGDRALRRLPAAGVARRPGQAGLLPTRGRQAARRRRSRGASARGARPPRNPRCAGGCRARCPPRDDRGCRRSRRSTGR